MRQGLVLKRYLYSLILFCLLLVSCSPPATPFASMTPSAPTLTNRWFELFQHTPVPWTTPLPPFEPTILDATYIKLDPNPATPFPCRRCPDYAVEGGIWKLSLDRGIFRILYAVNGWRSLGSYTISENHLFLFNDPNCPNVIGHYIYRLDNGALTLEEVEDSCSIHLRAANLTKQPWLSCTPPIVEAAVTDHWMKPAGCD